MKNLRRAVMATLLAIAYLFPSPVVTATEGCSGSNRASLEAGVLDVWSWHQCTKPSQARRRAHAARAQAARSRAHAARSRAVAKPYTERRVREATLNDVCRSQGKVLAEVDYTEVDPLAGSRRDTLNLIQCVAAPPVSRGGRPAPVLPPERIAVRDAVAERLPQPEVGIDPHIRGLTGLKTYLWYQNAGTRLDAIDHDRDPATAAVNGIQVSAAAGPYAITARAWIVEYRWDMGDGHRYTSAEPGSNERPAATHLYETKDDYVVTVETVWEAAYDWSAGGASGAGQLGKVARRASRDYRVHEVRSVLVG